MKRLVGACVLAVALSLFPAAGAEAGERNAQALTQDDVDRFVRHLTQFLEFRDLAGTRENRERMQAFAAEHDINMPRFFLAGTKIAIILMAETDAGEIPPLFRSPPPLVMTNDAERELVLENMPRIVEAFRNRAEAGLPATPDYADNGDLTAISVFQTVAAMPSAVGSPDRIPEVLQALVAPERRALWLYLAPALAAIVKNEPDSALEVFEAFPAKYPPETRGEAVEALVSRLTAVCLAMKGEPDAALAKFTETVERHGDSSTPGVQEQVALAMFGKGRLTDMAGEGEDAMREYDLLIEKFLSRDEPMVQIQVASAFNNQSVILSRQGRHDEAAARIDKALERYGDSGDPAMLEFLARMTVAKGVTILQAGRPDEAVRVFSDMAERFGERAEPDIVRHVAVALNNNIVIASRQRDPAAAMAAIDALTERFGGSEDPEIAEWVAGAALNKASLLLMSGDAPGALAALDTLPERESVAADSPLAPLMNEADWLRGQALASDGRPEEAAALFERMLEIHIADSSPEKWGDMVRTMSYLANARLDAGDAAGGADAYRELARLLLESGEADNREAASAAMRFRADALLAADDVGGAFAVLLEMLELFGEDKDPEISANVMYARNTLGDGSEARKTAMTIRSRVMRQMKQPGGETPAALDAIAAEYRDHPEPQVRAEVALAMTAKASHLLMLGDKDAALENLNALLETYSGDDAPEIRRVLAGAGKIKATVYAISGDREAAEKELRALIAAFEKDAGDDIVAAVLREAEQDLRRLKEEK